MDCGFITLCFWKHATLNGSIGYPESHLGSDLLTQTVSSSIPGLCYRISLTGIAFWLSLWEAMAYHVLVMTFGLRATLLISHKMCRGGPKDSPPCCILVGCYTVVSRMRRAPGSTTFTQVVLSLKDICHLISLYVENIISCLSSDKLSSKQV